MKYGMVEQSPYHCHWESLEWTGIDTMLFRHSQILTEEIVQVHQQRKIGEET